MATASLTAGGKIKITSASVDTYTTDIKYYSPMELDLRVDEYPAGKVISFYVFNPGLTKELLLEVTNVPSLRGWGNQAFGLTNPEAIQAQFDQIIDTPPAPGAIVTVQTAERLVSTNSAGVPTGGSLTIAAGARAYSIEALQGAFTLPPNAVVYAAYGDIPGVTKPMLPTGTGYPAVVITPTPNSLIWIEEIR